MELDIVTAVRTENAVYGRSVVLIVLENKLIRIKTKFLSLDVFCGAFLRSFENSILTFQH